MKSNKILSLLLLVLFVFASALTVSAVNQNVENIVEYTVESSDSIVYSGEIITVDIVIKQNKGFVHSWLNVVYGDMVTYVDNSWSTNGTVLNPAKLSAAHNPGNTTITVGDVGALMSPGTAEVFSATGKLASMKFQVKEGYEGPIDIKITADPANTMNSKGEMDFGVGCGVLSGVKSIDKATHVHTNEPIKGYPATCDEEGLTDGERCTVCQEITTAQKPIPALGHAMAESWTQTLAPKCESVGQEQRSCTRTGCGHTEKREIAATGHDMSDYVQTKAPTCEDKGLSTSKCNNGCGKTVTKDIPALGHDWNKTSGKDATCSAEGKKSLWVCKTCNATHKEHDGSVIEKLAHKPGVIPGKAATCTETGLTEGSKCLVCQDIITAQEVIPAGGHKYSNSYVNDNADKHWQECTVCGTKGNEGAHSLKNGVCSVCGYGCPHKGGKATCSSQAKCDLCGMMYGSTLPHTPGDAATCETDQICTVCNFVIVKADGHNYVDHAEKAPTCTEKGNKAYQTCTDCDYSTYEEVAALGHVLESFEAQSATCGQKGWDAYQTCTNCDYTTYKEIAPTGEHIYDNDCDADCNVCDEKRTPADHKFGEWEIVQEADVGEPGLKKQDCSVCGHSQTAVIPALEPTGLPWWVYALIALGVVSIIVVVVVIVQKKKN